jgi:trk system potassium uptake protein TrkH
VILALIQLGGLGIMTVSVVLFNFIGRKVSFRQRMAIQASFCPSPQEDLQSILKSILIFTGIAELIGVGLLFIHWSRELPPMEAIYFAVFHSVSAFCNAGFSLLEKSFINYRESMLLNFTICGLIISGGIGFPLVHELVHKLVHPGCRPARLSVHTKSVLVTNLALIVSGMLVFWVGEGNVSIGALSRKEMLLAGLFQSVTARTAGFNTVDVAGLSTATLAFILFLMFFGASPGSCGGGIKTTTLAVLAAFSWSRWRRKIRVDMFRKSIPDEVVTRSISLVVLAFAVVAFFFFMLLLSQPSSSLGSEGKAIFLEYLFEVVSAFGTVGLSMGVTADLTTFGKLMIVVVMLIGRVGILTFSFIITGRQSRNGYEHPEESLMIG